MKRLPEITILHVVACGMILLCHFFQDAKIGSLGEVFLGGLSLFFIVAGFLTGLKPAFNAKWLKSRFRRLLVPYFVIILIMMALIYCFTTDFNSKSASHLLLCAQGINYFYWPYNSYGSFPGMGHLWYVTIILLCFIITPLLDWTYKKLDLSLRRIYLSIAALVCIVQPLLILAGIQISYIISFLIGFIFARQNYTVTTQRFLCFVGIFVMITAIRFIGMAFIDGSIIYDRYIALVSQGATGWLVFATVFWLGRVVDDNMKTIGDSAIVLYLSSIIYEIYLLHYFFLRGPWPISKYIPNLLVADMLVVLLSIIVGTALSKGISKISKLFQYK